MVKVVVRYKQHPCARVEQWPSFEVKAVFYEVTSIMRAGMHKLAILCSAVLFPIIAFCSGVYFPHWPLLFDSVAERTSELEDAINVDGQVFAIYFPLEVPK